MPNKDLEDKGDSSLNNDLVCKRDIPLESAFKVPELRVKEQSTVTEHVDTEISNKVREQISIPTLKSCKSNKNDINGAPYTEPSFSGEPPPNYSFEVLKGGIIVSNVSLSEKPYIIFGRLGSCDVVLEHPSASRYHAVVQYRAIDDSEFSKGFYVFDLKSTHGTFLNKEEVQPNTYYRIHVGHMLKFGGSSRMYILQGPASDQEEESPYTVTELKEMAQLQKNREINAVENYNEENTVKECEPDEGIDWGMSEDAVEDTNTENPFAFSTCNEDLYLDDPKKTLRGWFEREGYELEYDVEEKGFGHFICRIHLPIENPTGQDIIAEASVKGKKKEAVIACALEACRILDRHGVLRQSQHESHKRKQKNWEEDDFYDSDEDVYLDRTGTIERKRETRKKILKKQSSAETYESLAKKLETIDTEINVIEMKLESSKVAAPTETEHPETDSLDAYMSLIKRKDIIDKQTKSMLKLQLSQLQKEKHLLQKLCKVACPTNLPVLNRPKLSEVVSKDRKKLPMIGSTKGSSHLKSKVQPKPNPKIEPKHLDENVEEEEEEEETENDTVKPTALENNIKESGNASQSILHDDSDRIHESYRNKLESGPAASSAQVLTTDSSNKQESIQKKQKEVNFKKEKKTVKKWQYDDENPDYSMWMPPNNQSGDGHTHLNEKFGY